MSYPPRRVDDDDKRPLTPSLWRLAPWQPMPAAQPYAMDWGDYRHGQPRRVGDLVVYVEDHVREELSQAMAAHPRLWLVVAAPPDSAEDRALRALLGRAPAVVEGELLWRPGPP